MASIHKHSSGRSPYWFAKFRDANGRVVIKSTKQTERTLALEVMLDWNRLAEQGRRRILTEAQCRKVMNELLEQVTGDSETIESNTTEQFLNNWVKGKVNAKSEGTATRYAGTIKLFLEDLGPRARLTLAAVTPRDIEKFRDDQIEEGKAASTVNVDLKTLRTAFNHARRQGILPNNPVEAVEFPEEQRHERGAFTPEQVSALVAAAQGDGSLPGQATDEAADYAKHGPRAAVGEVTIAGLAEGEWKTAILIGRYTGCRIGDAVSMTWENVNLEGDPKTITFVAGKTGEKVTVPLHPDLEAHFMAIAGDDPKAKLTPILADIPVGGRNGLSRYFKEIMHKAKVDDGLIENTTGGKGRAFSTYSFHSLRHAFVSDLANAGVTEELRMKLSGHTTSSSHQIYTKLQLKTMAEAVAKLPSIDTKAAK
jgi:site-specific recombinase XerD